MGNFDLSDLHVPAVSKSLGSVTFSELSTTKVSTAGQAKGWYQWKKRMRCYESKNPTVRKQLAICLVFGTPGPFSPSFAPIPPVPSLSIRVIVGYLLQNKFVIDIPYSTIALAERFVHKTSKWSSIHPSIHQFATHADPFPRTFPK